MIECGCALAVSPDQLAEHASTEHAQLQQSAQAAMEMLQQEKDKLQVQLQSQVSLLLTRPGHTLYTW